MKKLSKIHQRVAARVAVTSDSGSRAMRRQMREMGYTDGQTRKFEKLQLVQLRDPYYQEVSDAFDVRADEERKALKGAKDANCNREACQKPGAFFLNCGTSKYYCIECAVDIGAWSLRTRQDPMDLYPTFDEDIARYEKAIHEKAIHDKPAYARMQVGWAKRKFAEARQLYAKHTQKEK